MDELFEQIQGFGLTQYEAKAYLSLVTIGQANAYQVSKASGVPRARIYDTLEALLQRGIVMIEEEEEGSKLYLPLPVDVFLEQIKQKWENSFASVESGLKRLESREPKRDTYISTVRGEENILSFCRILIRRAKEQVLLSLWNPMYEKLLPDLLVRKNECRIQGITFGVQQPLQDLYAHRMNEYMAGIDERWFILCVDGKELLYGHSTEQDGNAFYTDDPVHIYLMEDYIWHDVLVNRLVAKGWQEQLDQWILPEMERFFGKKMLPDHLGIRDVDK